MTIKKFRYMKLGGLIATSLLVCYFIGIFFTKNKLEPVILSELPKDIATYAVPKVKEIEITPIKYNQIRNSEIGSENNSEEFKGLAETIRNANNDWRIRNYAVQHLALWYEVKGDKIAFAELLSASNDPNARVANTAIYNIARIYAKYGEKLKDYKETINLQLNSAFSKAEDPIIREAALRGISQVGVEGFSDSLVALLGSKENIPDPVLLASLDVVIQYDINVDEPAKLELSRKRASSKCPKVIKEKIDILIKGN